MVSLRLSCSSDGCRVDFLECCYYAYLLECVHKIDTTLFSVAQTRKSS
jgi:hypothetical protein